MAHLDWYIEIGGMVAAGAALMARAVRSAEVKAKRKEGGTTPWGEERGGEVGVDGRMVESNWSREG
jgi:hypothetical protein